MTVGGCETCLWKCSANSNDVQRFSHRVLLGGVVELGVMFYSHTLHLVEPAVQCICVSLLILHLGT